MTRSQERKEMESLREQVSINALGPNVVRHYAEMALERSRKLLDEEYILDAAEMARFASDLLQSLGDGPRKDRD